MKLLLDTHVVIWFLKRDPALSDVAREAIRNDENEVVECLW